MIFRRLVASICTVGCIISVLAPIEASARSGGLTTGSGRGFHGAGPRPALPPAVHSGRARTLVTRSAAVPIIHPAHVAPVRRFHRVFGARLPRDGIGVYYGSIYNPDDFIGVVGQYPHVQAIANTPPLREDDGAVVIGRRCSSQTVVVPAEAGGEQPITVTRCRSE
jgi:hypothetical protein